MKAIFTAFLITLCIAINAQSYEVDWYNDDYDTLTNYTSILYELLEEPILSYQEYELDFGFSFPFFDNSYNSIVVDGSGYAYFQDSEEDYHLYMFAGEFERHFRLNIHSDWRFIRETGLLKIEWRNVGINDDINSPFPTNHFINFQTWFYENGIIEYRFGDIDLENTPFYDENSGFIWEDGESYGPWISIQNTDLTEMYYITGTNSNIQVVSDPESVDIFYDIPTFGTVFRFIPAEIVNTKFATDTDFDINVYPNPTKGKTRIETPGITKGIIVLCSSTGQRITEMQIIKEVTEIDLSDFLPGLYLCYVISEAKTGVYKIVVK